MFSFVASAILLSNVITTHVAEVSETNTPTTVREVNTSQSLEKFRRAQAESEKKRQEATDEFKLRREAAANKIKENRTEFREKLAEISDERKREVVENLSERFDSVNEKWVSHWNSVLSRLSSIVAKIEERSEGEVDTAEAESAIATAQEAVNTQAAKVYEIEFDSEAELRPQMKELIFEFHTDLRNTQAAVKTARDEVHELFRQLKGKEDAE